jgi:hypothetical protein
MKNSLVKLSITYLGVCSLMTGCVYGENKTFFEDTKPEVSAIGPLPTLPSGEPQPINPATPNPPAEPTQAPPVVCDPLGSSGASAEANNGIQASLYYFNAEERSPDGVPEVAEFFRSGHKVNADFFFNTINTPTRYFTHGFQLPDGSSIEDSNGNLLLENFAFKFKTSIKLPAGAGVKKKQFAILADDGANLLVQDPITGEWSNNVNNDGLHSTRFACGAMPVSVGSDYLTPIEMQYYQGPRYYIAAVLVWRDWNGDQGDAWCGSTGDSVFFDSSSSPSVAKEPWLDILSRWEVVPANVMYLEPTVVNPCK